MKRLSWESAVVSKAMPNSDSPAPIQPSRPMLAGWADSWPSCTGRLTTHSSGAWKAKTIRSEAWA